MNRTSICRLFLDSLNADPPRRCILYLHGDGGNGKSLLLDHLRTRLAKRIAPDNWAYLAKLPDVECVAQVATAEDTRPIAIGRLDFGLGHRDGFDALLKLRRDLGGSGMRFLLFDMAVVTYLHKSRQLSREHLGSLFPTDELDLLQEVATLIGEVPGASLAVSVMQVFDRRFGGWFQRYQQRRGIDEAQLATIDRMDHESELIRELPRFFARDLSATTGQLGTPERAVLFFDAHEAFWGRERDLVGDLYFARDEWMRRLMSSLDPDAGVIVVISGREPPRWAQAPVIPITDLDLRHIGDLAEADALAYLARAGITEPVLCQRLLEDARSGPEAVHPFSLALGADLALAAAKRSDTLTDDDLRLGPQSGSRRRRLVDRLLRYVDADVRNAVRAVATCRSFDWDTYRYLGAELGFVATRAGFETLGGFSFIRQGDGNRLRVHDLLRRLQTEEADEMVQEAHEAMERYHWRKAEAGDDAAIVDAIYHANQLDWRRGVEAWLDAFTSALQFRQFPRCRALMEIRDDLVNDGGIVSAALATQEGEYWYRQRRFDEAGAANTTALAVLDAILDDELVPEALNDRGNVLASLADIEREQGDWVRANALLREAADSVAAAIGADPTAFGYLSNIGGILVKLGDAEAVTGDNIAARRSYGRAFSAVAAALRLAPSEPPLLNDLGNVLLHVGKFEASLGRNEAAARNLRLAIACFDGASRLVPGDPVVHNNRGSACHNIGRLYASQRRRKASQRWYRSAIRATDRALWLAPGYPVALSNKGMFCEELAWLIAGWSRSARAREVVALRRNARDAFVNASAIAPGDENLRGSAERLRAAIGQENDQDGSKTKTES